MRVLGLVILVCLSSAAFAEDEKEKKVELEVLHELPGIDVVFSVNSWIMAHGGPPASLYDMHMNLEVRDRRAHTISVRGLALLEDCRRKQRTSQKLKITGHEISVWDSEKETKVTKGTASVRTQSGKPERYSMRVTFDGVKSDGGCAFAVDLVIDGVRKKIELPVTIKQLLPHRLDRE